MRTITTIAALIASITFAASAQASQELEGDQRVACEVVMCLSAGKPPHECDGPLKRYYSIQARKMGELQRARGDFLRKCPIKEMIESKVQ